MKKGIIFAVMALVGCVDILAQEEIGVYDSPYVQQFKSEAPLLRIHDDITPSFDRSLQMMSEDDLQRCLDHAKDNNLRVAYSYILANYADRINGSVQSSVRDSTSIDTPSLDEQDFVDSNPNAGERFKNSVTDHQKPAQLSGNAKNKLRSAIQRGQAAAYTSRKSTIHHPPSHDKRVGWDEEVHVVQDEE